VKAEIVSLSAYESQVSALLNEDERTAMEFYIACAPEDHPVIPGAGGFRKARWAGKGSGADLHGCDLRQIAEGDPFGGRSAPARKTRGTNQKSSKGRVIIMGVRTVNTGTKGRTKFGVALEQSAREILAHVKGDVRLPTRRIVLPDEIDVKRIRTKARMSQAEFARILYKSENTTGMGARTEKT
jgi:hypothetical protein